MLSQNYGIAQQIEQNMKSLYTHTIEFVIANARGGEVRDIQHRSFAAMP
ncbi:MAG: hypothetical protein HYZ34_12705 [Ignavibacteriae bacterium]|nr:hypothetical protein [Ignavibacteriota bacterium]